jgi:hypothetical protein
MTLLIKRPIHNSGDRDIGYCQSHCKSHCKRLCKSHCKRLCKNVGLKALNKHLIFSSHLL